MKKYLLELSKQLGLFGSKIILSGLIIIIIASAGVSVFDQYVKAERKKDSMVVTGTANAKIKPDIVKISVGIEMLGKDPIQMQDNASGIINTAIAKFKELGVADENIETTKFEFSTNKNGSIDDLMLKIILNLRITEIEASEKKPGLILKTAIESGLNKIYGLSYDISNRVEMENELRNVALENAKREKESIESRTGVRLGMIRKVDLGYTRYPYYYDDISYSMNSNKDDVLDVKVGSEEIVKKVTIEYEIL